MKPTLPTNYKDDILNTSVEGMRRYQMIYNSDNTVSFKDVTPYDQTGSDFGAGDINLTNKAVNQSADAEKIIDDPDTAEATTEEGYIAGVQLFNHVNDSLSAKNITDFFDSTTSDYVYKVNANNFLVELSITVPNIPTGTWVTVGVIDEKYRPLKNIRILGIVASNVALVSFINIAPDGIVTAYQASGTTSDIYCCGVYLCK